VLVTDSDGARPPIAVLLEERVAAKFVELIHGRLDSRRRCEVRKVHGRAILLAGFDEINPGTREGGQPTLDRAVAGLESGKLHRSPSVVGAGRACRLESARSTGS
jgi:hypothetical protein